MQTKIVLTQQHISMLKSNQSHRLSVRALKMPQTFRLFITKVCCKSEILIEKRNLPPVHANSQNCGYCINFKQRNKMKNNQGYECFCMDFAGNKILDFNADLTTSHHCAQIKTLFVAYLLPLQLVSSMSSLDGQQRCFQHFFFDDQQTATVPDDSLKRL